MTVYNLHREALAYNGMSLRDYFAAAALAYSIGKPGVTAATKAQDAYEIADAMMRYREKGE